jgi:hypothetical protein
VRKSHKKLTIKRYSDILNTLCTICSMILWFVVVAAGVARIVIVLDIQATRPLTLPEGQIPWWPCVAKSGVPWREHRPRALQPLSEMLTLCQQLMDIFHSCDRVNMRANRKRGEAYSSRARYSRSADPHVRQSSLHHHRHGFVCGVSFLQDPSRYSPPLRHGLLPAGLV